MLKITAAHSWLVPILVLSTTDAGLDPGAALPPGLASLSPGTGALLITASASLGEASACPLRRSASHALAKAPVSPARRANSQ